MRRLAARRGTAQAHASLAGIALALRALSQLLARAVAPGEIVFAQGEKPRLASQPALAAAAGGTLRAVRGVRWHLARLDLFPGASACVLSSAPATVEAHAVPLAELFAP